MKYLVSIILFSTLLFSADLDWPSDYDEALLQAKKEKKDIYILIGSATCPWCEKFENEVLMNDEVIKRLKKDYVLVYLSKEIDDIPEHLEVRPIPRHYFLTENGEIIYTTIGYRNIENFYDVLDDVKESKEED